MAIESMDSPRFRPMDDAENAAAHGMEPSQKQEEMADTEREEEVQATIQGLVQDAVDHYRELIEPDQVKATEYYHGRPFGDEKPGRSQVVATTVRDVTLMQLPSIIRTVFDPEQLVEYAGFGPEDDDWAREATEHTNHVVLHDNPGFLHIHNWVQDALVRRLGVVKWWWEEFYRTEVSEHSGLTEEELMMLVSDPEVEIDSLRPVQMQIEMQPGVWQPLTTYEVRVIRVHNKGCEKFDVVPPEEFFYTPNARTLEEAPLVAHIREMPSDKVLAMGFATEDEIEAAAGRQEIVSTSLDVARQIHGSSTLDESGEENLDKSQRPVLYGEVYALIDGDGDGIAERRKFHVLGRDYQIAGDPLGEIVDELPFGDWTPNPEAHTVVGLSNYDLAGDIQRIVSQLERATLDSLAQAVNPDTVVVEGEVNYGDLTKTDASRIIRTRKPGMLEVLKYPWVGSDTLPMLDYQERKLEVRTGHNKQSQGLDADAMQSTTKAAVAGILTAAQQRLEMIVRVFAETGLKKLFKGLLRLSIKHRNQPRTIRMGGKYISVDPRHWNAEYDVRVNVALGQGTPEDKKMSLEATLSSQLTLMQAGAPFVTWVEVRATAARLAELGGHRHTERFFRPWGHAEQDQYMQMVSQQPQEPSPEMMFVQVELMKVQGQQQIEQAKLALEQWKAQHEDDRERDRMVREMALKEAEISAKATIEREKIAAQVAKDRAESEKQENAA